MKINFILFSFLTVSLNIVAQTKSFYNQFWEKTNENKALYYSLSSYNKDKKLYESYDYFFNDSLQMKAFYKDKSLSIRDGEFNYYHFNGHQSLIKNYENNQLQGPYKAFFENGILQETGEYVNNSKSGTWKTYYESGQLKSITIYNGNIANYSSFYENGNTNETGKLLSDQRTGTWKKYDNQKSLLSLGAFKGNVRQNRWVYYFDNGQISAQIDFVNGAITSQKYWLENGEIVKDGKVNYAPTYKNGQTSINQYFIDHCDLNYLKNKGLKGKTYFSFIILPDGSITQVKLIKGIYSAVSIALVEKLKMMNGWTAGLLYNRRMPIEHVMAIDIEIFNLD